MADPGHEYLRDALRHAGLDELIERIDDPGARPESVEAVEREWTLLGRALAGGALNAVQVTRALLELGLVDRAHGPSGTDPAVIRLEPAGERPLVAGPRFIVHFEGGAGYLCAPLGVRSRSDTGELSIEPS